MEKRHAAAPAPPLPGSRVFPRSVCASPSRVFPTWDDERSSAARVRGRVLSGEGVTPHPDLTVRPLPQGEVNQRQTFIGYRPHPHPLSLPTRGRETRAFFATRFRISL